MPELRKDPILDDWLIVAESRALRPNQFARPAQDQSGPPCSPSQPQLAGEEATDGAAKGPCAPEPGCPFCRGHERQTPQELLVVRRLAPADSSDWQVRVVPNKYPALVPEPLPIDSGSQDNGLCRSIPGAGAHEVVIESPLHVERTSELSDAQLAQVLQAVRDRFRSWKQREGWKYGIWFKNAGEAAGASMEHLHSQLIGLPLVPARIGQQLAASRAFYERHNRCIYCRLVSEEIETGDRLVHRTDQLVAFCPFASRFAYETWIVPRYHASHFEDSESEELNLLAVVLRRILKRIETVVASSAYNVILHTAPFDTDGLPHYHWHIEVLPQTSRPAGFEWGTGMAVNPVPPAKAALLLKVDPF
ncbi:MAG: DUF4931 domain-containing protein [Pirellulales bacterium]